MLLALWLGGALGAETTRPCALEGVPGGRVYWDGSGVLRLLTEDGRTVAEAELGAMVPTWAELTCRGTRVELFLGEKNVTFGFQRIKVDFESPISQFHQRDPTELGLKEVRQLLADGSWAEAEARLTSLPAIAEVFALFLEVGRSVAAAGPQDDNGFALALRCLALGGASVEEQDALRRAQWALWIARDRAAEALVQVEAALQAGGGGELLVQLGDARWALGDKKGARLAYAEAGPVATLPPRVAERCRACR